MCGDHPKTSSTCRHHLSRCVDRKRGVARGKDMRRIPSRDVIEVVNIADRVQRHGSLLVSDGR